MAKERRLVFISWAENCSRSDSIAARLGGTSHMVYSPFWGSRIATVPFKYLVQTWRTLSILFHEKPQVVVVMVPPVVACLPVWLYCLLTGARFAIDAHTGAFLNLRWRRLQFLQRFFCRRAVTTIVTNEYLSGLVEGCDAAAMIVADVPIVFAEAKVTAIEPATTYMTLVSSFCYDEPLAEFLQAARHASTVQFYITGDDANLNNRLRDMIPANVNCTGFLTDGEYTLLLTNSDAVIAITTLDHTMQRGAYEAIYLGKPVITSNFDILRKAFPKGAVHVEPTAAGIANGIREMQADLARYTREAEELREEKLRNWDAVAADLRRILQLDALSNEVAAAAASNA